MEKSILTVMFRCTVNGMWFNMFDWSFWRSIRCVCNWFIVVFAEWLCILHSLTILNGIIYARKIVFASFFKSVPKLFFLNVLFTLTASSVIWVWKGRKKSVQKKLEILLTALLWGIVVGMTTRMAAGMWGTGGWWGAWGTRDATWRACW